MRRYRKKASRYKGMDECADGRKACTKGGREGS
jgi:hypothetical protein